MPKVTKKSKNGELKLAMIESGKEIHRVLGDRIPEGGHISICVWPDHIFATLCSKGDGGFSNIHVCADPIKGGAWEVWE